MRELTLTDVRDQLGAFASSLFVSAVCGIIIAITAPAEIFVFLKHGATYSFVPLICAIIILCICYHEFPGIGMVFLIPVILGTILGYSILYSAIFWIKILLIIGVPILAGLFIKSKVV